MECFIHISNKPDIFLENYINFTITFRCQQKLVVFWNSIIFSYKTYKPEFSTEIIHHFLILLSNLPGFDQLQKHLRSHQWLRFPPESADWKQDGLLLVVRSAICVVFYFFEIFESPVHWKRERQIMYHVPMAHFNGEIFIFRKQEAQSGNAFPCAFCGIWAGLAISFL